MSGTLLRAAIIAEAKRWIGTPYVHQASAMGVGCDCLGLVRGVWRATQGEEPETPPPYTPDWAERGGVETLLAAAQKHLTPRPAPSPGDVLMFRMANDAPIKHCAIMTHPERIVHAYWGRAVVESRLSLWWATRLAGVFAFPGADHG
jgi:NlpC/P60 family putative phage cell wall peptidase